MTHFFCYQWSLLLILLTLPLAAMSRDYTVVTNHYYEGGVAPDHHYQCRITISFSDDNGMVEFPGKTVFHDAYNTVDENGEGLEGKGKVKAGETINVTYEVLMVTGLSKQGYPLEYRATIAFAEPPISSNYNRGEDYVLQSFKGTSLPLVAKFSWTVPETNKWNKPLEKFRLYLGSNDSWSGYDTSEVIDFEVVEEDLSESHVEEDNDAWGFEGVWPFTIPASVIIGLLGYTLTKGKPKKDDDDEDPKHPYPRKMLIHKDFGDTLIAGENPRLVYAMIVRKTKSGDEVPDPIMTKMITISAGDKYMLVKDDGMHGDWRAAWIQAPDVDQIPEEGIINFFMGNEGGSYTNRIHFKIEAGKVLFGQDNLTLPAHYKQEVRLPFVVVGYDGSKDVTATILDTGDKPTDFYNVRVEWNEKKQLHEAVIRDLKLDEKTDNGTPGNFIPLTLKVEAQHPGGRKIEGWISMARYYMGLVLKMGDMKCYVEEYNPSKHKKLTVGVIRGGKQFVPAETVGRLLLYDYDEASHQIIIINPIPSAEGFSIKAVDEAENRQVQGIGINCDVVDNKDPKGTECVFRCVLGALDPPSRIDAIIHVETEVEGKRYAYDKQVLLCSQPWRSFQTDAEWSSAAKEDEEIKRKLNQLIEHIERQGLAGKLLPIIKYIDNMLIGYEFNYGFDRDQLHFVGAMYNHMLTERQEYTFNESPTPITLGDEMLMFAQSVIDTSLKPAASAVNKFNEKFGVPLLIARIGIGFWTYGASEAFFKAYDAVCIGVTAFNLAEIYVNEGKDGLTKNLVVMAKDTAKFQILMTGVQIGLHLGFSGLRAKYNPRTSPSVSTPVQSSDIKPKSQPQASKKQFSSSKKGRITKEALKEAQTKQQKAAQEVLSPEAEMKTKGLKPERDLTDAVNYTKAKANRNIEDLHAVIEMCEQNPTPENKALMRKIIIEVQADKTAMHKLKNLGSEYQHVREVFNKEWFGEKGINQKVNKKVIAELAAEHGLTPDQIKIENISSKKLEKLMSGDTSTMDLDTTYYYLNKQGEKVYFNQKTTEQMYNRHLHKEALGYEANSQAAADKFAHKVDRTVIEDVAHHQESFGKEDVGRMMDSTRHAESLENPNKVSDAIIYKSEERFSRAEELFKKSDTITDHWEKMEVQRQAINELLEGGYMTAKDADNFVIPMDIARKDVNGGLLVSNKLQRAIEHCRLVDTKDPINVVQLELRIKSEGYNSFNELAKDLGDTMRRVGSPKLSAPSIRLP